MVFFKSDVVPPYGQPRLVTAGTRRVVARNPGPYTLYGTNTYIVGRGRVTVIDPGPADEAHVGAVLAALEPGETIAAVLVTHTHWDHSPAAEALRRETGAPVYGFGPLPQPGGSPVTHVDVASNTAVHRDFRPDQRVTDGQLLRFAGRSFRALHTPGHISNHLAFHDLSENIVFTGDIVLSYAAPVIALPDGSVDDYVASLHAIRAVKAASLLPSHGEIILDPIGFIDGCLSHRVDRLVGIWTVLGRGRTDRATLLAAVYSHVGASLATACRLSIDAHLDFFGKRQWIDDDGDSVCISAIGAGIGPEDIAAVVFDGDTAGVRSRDDDVCAA